MSTTTHHQTVCSWLAAAISIFETWRHQPELDVGRKGDRCIIQGGLPWIGWLKFRLRLQYQPLMLM